MILPRPTLPLLFMTVLTAGAVDFKKDIEPILEKNCYECHSEKNKKRKGGFVFDELETFKLDIADNDVAQIRPGKPAESHFLEVIVNPDHDRHMPPDDQLSSGDIKKLTEWITEGASFEKNDGTKPMVAAAPKKDLPPIMSWTNLEGKTIRAGFVRLDGENVVLRMPANGAEVPYPLAKLSPESVKQAQESGAP